MANPQDLLSQNIIAALGLESLPNEEKAEMLQKMSDLVMRRVMLRVMDELSDEDVAALPKETEGPEAILAFVAEKVPGFDKIMEEEVVKLKQEMLTAAEQVE
jgi:hypothetical protein